MSTFSRYVFRQAAAAFLLILLSLCSIVWIALALRQLNVVTSQGQDSLMLVKITTLALPNLMAIIAPVAFLIAALHTLNRLNTDSELIVMTASGATIWSAARPLLFLALLVTIGLGIINHLGQPWSFRVLKDLMIQVRTDLLTQVIQPGRFSSPEPDLTFHIRERSLNGELLGLVMHDTREKDRAQSYLAERGVIVKQDKTAYLVMSAGHIIRRADPQNPPQIVAFDKYAVDLDRFEPRGKAAEEWRPRERYFNELLNPDPNCRICQSQVGKFRAEFHERIATLLYPFAFALIITAFVGQARSTRSTRMESLIVAFVAAAGLRLGGLAVNNLVTANAMFVPVMYLLPIGAMALSLIIIKAADRQKSGLDFVDKIVSAVSQAMAPLVAAMRPKSRGAAP